MVRDESKFEFKSEISDYVLNIQPAEERAIVSFKADNHGFECKFTIIIEKDGKEGIMDLDGTVLVPPIFDKVVYTYSRILMKADKPAVVINNGKFGLV